MVWHREHCSALPRSENFVLDSKNSAVKPDKVRRKSGLGPAEVRRNLGLGPAEVRRNLGLGPAKVRRKLETRPCRGSKKLKTRPSIKHLFDGDLGIQKGSDFKVGIASRVIRWSSTDSAINSNPRGTSGTPRFL